MKDGRKTVTFRICVVLGKYVVFVQLVQRCGKYFPHELQPAGKYFPSAVKYFPASIILCAVRTTIRKRF